VARTAGRAGPRSRAVLGRGAGVALGRRRPAAGLRDTKPPSFAGWSTR
jgi:hypothetical protein